MKKREVYASVCSHQNSGYHHILVRFYSAEPDDMIEARKKNDMPWNLFDCQFKGLQVQNQYGGLTDTRRAYGYQLDAEGTYDINDMERLVKTMRLTHRKLRQIELAEGYAHDYLTYMTYLFRAMGVKNVFFIGKRQPWLPLGRAMDELRSMDSQISESLGGAQ